MLLGTFPALGPPTPPRADHDQARGAERQSQPDK